MKRFFTLMAAVLVCVSGMMAAVGGKLRIPDMDHMTVVVTRGGETLAEGDSVWSGDVLNIRYTPDAHYCIARERVLSKQKTLTLTDNDFCQDWSYLADGANQGFTRCQPNGNHFEMVGYDGWKHRFPGYYGSTSEESTLSFTTPVTGTVTISMIRGLNSDFTQWGKFKLYWQLNGTQQSSAVRDYTSTYNRPGYTLFYDTITVSLNENDVLGFTGKKVDKGTWNDDGREWYIGSIHLLGGGDFFIEPVAAEEMYKVVFVPGEHINVEAQVTEFGMTIASGDYMPWDVHVAYSFTPAPRYKFTDGAADESDTIQLNDNYSGYNKTDKTLTITCTKTAEFDPDALFPLDVTVPDHVTLDSVSLDGLPFASGDNAKVGQVLYYRIKAESGYIFLDGTTEKEVSLPLTFEMVDASTLHFAIALDVVEQIKQFTLFLQPADHTTLDSASVNGIAYHAGDVVSTGDQVFYRLVAEDGWFFTNGKNFLEVTVGISAAMADADDKITITGATPEFVTYYELVFNVPEHVTLTNVQVDGDEWNGEPVREGATVVYSLQADEHYEFGEGTGSTAASSSFQVAADVADADRKITIQCPEVTYIKPYILHFVEGLHFHFDSVWVNGKAFGNDAEAWFGDYAEYVFRADEGYEFEADEVEFRDYANIPPFPAVNPGDTLFIYCDYKKAVKLPEYVFVWNLPNHATVDVEVNHLPFANGDILHLGDSVLFTLTADYGYYFAWSGDTVLSDSFVVQRGMSETDTIAWIDIPDASIKRPDVKIQMLDSTTAHISWDGIFTESKILVTPYSLSGNPYYAKGFTYLNENEITIDTLTPGEGYYVYVIGLKPEMSEVSQEYFVAIYREGGDEFQPTTNCGFTINMYDSYGDGWNGSTLRFIENGVQQDITLSSGRTGTAEYQSFGDTVSIYWVKGSWTSEVSFDIRDAFGAVVYSIAQGEAESIADGALLYQGVLCLVCGGSVENIDYNVDSTDFRLTWTGVNSIAYDVVITQKSNPTYKELEELATRQDTAGYAFTGKQWMGYNAYIRSICPDSVPASWNRVLLYEGLPYEKCEPYMRANAKNVTLDYEESGDILANTVLGTNGGSEFYPVFAYRFQLTDTIDIVTSFEGENINPYSDVFGTILVDTAANAPMQYVDDFLPGDTIFGVTGEFYLMYSINNRLGDYSLAFRQAEYLQAKPIEPDYTETGDFTDAFISISQWGDTIASKLFSYTPTDSIVDICFSVSTSAFDANHMIYYPALFYSVYRDTIDDSHELFEYPANMQAFSGRVEKGHTYYFRLDFGIDSHYGYELTDDYTIQLLKAVPIAADTITLDFAESGTFRDATEWLNTYVGSTTYSKAYVYIPADTTDILVTVDGNNENMANGIFVYVNEISQRKMWDAEAYPTIFRMTCLKDSAYFFVLSSMPQYGGTRQDTYDLRISKLTEPIMPDITGTIAPDTIVTGVLTNADFISDMNTRAKIYEFVAYKNEKLALGIFIDDYSGMMYGSYSCYIFKDTLDLYGAPYTSFSSSMIPTTLEGSPEGTHYYFVVLGGGSLTNVPFNLHLRREMNYNNPATLGTVEVGKNYTSEMTIFDAYTYHSWPGSAQAYNFHAERGKKYRITMHRLGYTQVSGCLCVSVLDPALRLGTYDGNLVSTGSGSDDSWSVITFAPDETGDYILMFDHYIDMGYYDLDTLRYEFLITEYIEFQDMINRAEYVALPHNELGNFTPASTKVLYNSEYQFNTPHSYISNYGGIYNAKAYTVLVPAGDTLIVEFSGSDDIDVGIGIYDFSTESTAHSPNWEYSYYSYDETRVENGYINYGKTAKIIYVVISEYDVNLGESAWSLNMGLGLKTLEGQLATAVASQDKITIYSNQDEQDAVAALSELQLTALDAATGQAIGLIYNFSAYWTVDLDNGIARYEVNDSDLPAGYRFADMTDWIEVAIEILPYGEGIENTDEEETFQVRKFIRDGHVYIQTPQGIFNIMGQRVE